MTRRITAKDLDALADYLNHDRETERDSIGGYRISKAYGGYNLVQKVNNGGGERDVIVGYHMPARELDALIRAYMAGRHDEKHGKV